ncbi:MAG: ATP-dependent metallopeptidase FtsH/Yme1/Tma family protein, partial [Alphaproteobacteria bacterium]
MNIFGRNIALWIIIALLVLGLFNLFRNPTEHEPKSVLAYSDFTAAVDGKQVRDALIQGNTISGHFTDGRAYSTYAPTDPGLIQQLRNSGVTIKAAPPEEEAPSLFAIFLNWAPMLLLIGVWVFFMRQMQGGGGKAMGFGKSRARLLTERQGRITFDDVAGI